ncbi:hypothetical protein [Prevotella sp.]|nr:hypothetical protein [Prevotella sp.]
MTAKLPHFFANGKNELGKQIQKGKNQGIQPTLLGVFVNKKEAMTQMP